MTEYKATSGSAYRVKCPLCKILLPNTDEAKRAHEGGPVHQHLLRQIEEAQPKKEPDRGEEEAVAPKGKAHARRRNRPRQEAE